MLENPSVDIHVLDEKTGVNCFWLAAYYENGEVMKILAEKGIDIMNVHNKTKSNALHVATDRKNIDLVKMLIDSGFPMNNTKIGNVTALVSSCIDKDNDPVTKLLIKLGADLNVVTDDGSSALVEAVKQENIGLVKMLLRKGAYIHHKDKQHEFKSPFYHALHQQYIPAMELFCDHGAGPGVKGDNQMTLIYAAENGYDDMALYLSLRAADVNFENEEGKNVFTMYLLKQDIDRCTILLMRNADINYVNRFGKTPLHLAIENNLDEVTVKFLLSQGADPFIQDKEGIDVCDKVKNRLYINKSGANYSAKSN